MEIAIQNVNETVEALVRGAVPLAEIRDLTRHPAMLVRVNALTALVKYAKADDEVVRDIVAAATDPANSVRLMGTISVGHVAVGCLDDIGTPAAAAAAADLLATWPESDRGDLAWYLRSERAPHAGQRPKAI